MGSQQSEEVQLVNLFYTLKENEIFKHNYTAKTSEKIFTVDHCFTPRVAYTQKGRIFLIGGS